MKMELVDCSSSKDKFTIVKFTNGDLKTSEAQRMEFELCKDSKKKNSNSDRELVAQADGVRYVGSNHNKLSSDEQGLMRYMVGVHDKKTGKMKIYDADVFTMFPQFADDSHSDSDQTDIPYLDKSDALYSAFGSKKRKIGISARQKNQLKDSALQESVGTAVNDTLATPNIDKLITPAVTQKVAKEIPPYNEDATVAQEVYPLSSIISDSELESLKSVADEFFNSTKDVIDEWEAQKKYPSYVLQHLRVMPISEQPRLLRSCTLLYLCYLMHLFKLSFKDLRQKNPFVPAFKVPDTLKTNMLDCFTIVPEGCKERMMTARHKDKLLSYMLVLCLIIDEFNMSYIDLLRDLKIAEKRLKTSIRALGCKITSKKVAGESFSVVTLPIPLTFPDSEKRGRGEKTRR